MSARRRILFLTALPLHHPRSGGTIKSAAVLAHLERNHDIDVACLSPGGTSWTRDRGEVVSVPLARPRSAGRLLSSYLSRVPLSVERNRTPALAAAVNELEGHRPHDVVFVDGWLMAQYVPSSFRGVRMLHQHNVEHRLWESHAAIERNVVRRTLVRVEAKRIRAYEAEMLGRFDLVFAVSEADRRAFVALGAAPERTLVLPNVADASLLDRPKLEPPREPVVLFLGTLSWPPNTEGLERFLGHAASALRARVPGLAIVIAGRGASERLRALTAASRVELLEDVEDDEPVYLRARCFVDASVGGAGTRVKILNAMARGVPVVATRDAASGLEVRAGVHLLEAGDPDSLPEPISRVLGDDDLWRRLSAEGRRLVRERYSADTAFAALEEALGSA